MLPGVHVPVVQAALHDRTREGHLDHVQVREAENLQCRGRDVVQLADQLRGDERVRDAVALLVRHEGLERHPERPGVLRSHLEREFAQRPGRIARVSHHGAP